MKFLQLGFLPRNPDLALLILRLWLGASMLALHGLPKLQDLVSGNHKFADPLGIGSLRSLSLAVAFEVGSALLLMLGLFTRLAALSLVGTMAIAFAITHKMQLTGDNSGEKAFIYLAGYLTIFLAGSGKYAVNSQG